LVSLCNEPLYVVWQNDRTGLYLKNMQNFKLDINKLSTRTSC